MEKMIRLRDFVKFKGCYFSVVSYFNSNYVKCLLRYIPCEMLTKKDKKQEVRVGDLCYVKLNHSEALEYFKEYQKDGIFFIPEKGVSVLKPEVLTPEIVKRDEKVARVYDLFSPIPKTHKGITGSRLIGLAKESSDVDFVVYGKWWNTAREIVKKGIESGLLQYPDWKKIYEKRKPVIDFETFVAHELRKFNRAVLNGIYFDLLYVRDYDCLHIYPEVSGVKLGRVKLRGVVKDDSAVFDYPARYPLANVDLKIREVEVLCFTHTYTAQAFKGERVEVSGVLEKTPEGYKVIVGTRRESDEYIISEDLVKRLRR